MKCPICETPIQSDEAKKCSQCDSDLEVYKTLSELNHPLEPQAALPVAPTPTPWRMSLWVFVCVMGAVLVLLLGIGYHSQTTLLNELNQERVNRQLSEERSAKLTEKLTEKFIEKTTLMAESFSGTMQTMVNANKEQRDAIAQLSEKITTLEDKAKKLELAKGRDKAGPLSNKNGAIKKN